MQTIKEDIRNKSFHRVYLLYGKEDYLKIQYKNNLLHALLADGDTMNYARFEGAQTPIAKLIDLAETMPFFAEHRVILVEDSGFFKSAAPELADYLPGIPDTTCMIFVEKEVDKRSRTYKALKDVGYAVDFKTPDEKTLARWILSVLKTNRKRITQETLLYFLDKVGNNDMENIAGELEKLICYVGERETIHREDVEEICTEQVENKIFEMINMISEKRKDKALKLYYDLLELKEPPLRILFLMVRQFNTLLQVKTMVGAGIDNDRIADRAGLRSFMVRKYRSQAGYFQTAQLQEALRDCAQAEEDIKTGKLNDRIGVEMILVKYSKIKKASD